MNQTSLNYIKDIAIYHVNKCSCSYTDLGYLAVPTANITAIAVAIYTATVSSTSVATANFSSILLYCLLHIHQYTLHHSTSCDVCDVYTCKSLKLPVLDTANESQEKVLTLRQNTMVPPCFKSSQLCT